MSCENTDKEQAGGKTDENSFRYTCTYHCQRTCIQYDTMLMKICRIFATEMNRRFLYRHKSVPDSLYTQKRMRLGTFSLI